MIKRTSLGLLAIVALLIAGVFAARLWVRHERGDQNALWRIVHELCATDERTNRIPAPCVAVDLNAGYAVLKGGARGSEVMVIPTARVSGIESQAVRGPGAPNYFQDAWLARRFVAQFRPLRSVGRDDVALAINSVFARSQNQLHIHVDCIRPDVKDALAANLDRIGPRWAPLETPLAGRRYRAMWLPGADLTGHNPFDLLADANPVARADMGRETLIVAPVTTASGEQGFVLLADRANRLQQDIGHGEDLLDHDCRVLARAGVST